MKCRKEKEMTEEKELGKALKNNQDYIEIEGKLCEKVIKIKGIGKVAWGVCAGAIAIAIIGVVSSAGTAGAATPISALVAAPGLTGTVGILGVPTTATAIAIAAAGGGVGSLNKLRKYDLERVSKSKVILHRKK